MGQLALKALAETPLRDIAPIITRVQVERKKRGHKKEQHSEEKFGHPSLDELLVDVVASPSKDPPPEEDSDGSMPGLVVASSSDDMPVPEEDSSDEEDTQPTIYAARLVKKCRDEWCSGVPLT